MKTLYLLRHAKSSYPQEVDDFERSLNAQGKKAATQMGNYIKEQLAVPDKILCSSATRAQQTARAVSRVLDIEDKIAYSDRLYLASAGDILRAINVLTDDVNTTMLVGHNPGIAHLAELLIKDGNQDAQYSIQNKYPTAGLTIFSVDSWATLEPRSATLRDFITPKQLRNS